VSLARELGASADALERSARLLCSPGPDRETGRALFQFAGGGNLFNPFESRTRLPATFSTPTAHSTRCGEIWNRRFAKALTGGSRLLGGRPQSSTISSRTDEARRDFLSGMNGFGQLSSPAVVAAFDLGRFCRLVDLGGGTGHLALTACARYPRPSGYSFRFACCHRHRSRICGMQLRARSALAFDRRATSLPTPLPEADILCPWPRSARLVVKR
jgi:hypothetical protein